MKYLIYLLLALPALAFGTLNEVDKQLLAAKNLLSNGGFENGKAGTSATGGTYNLETNDIINNGISGRVTAEWDPSAADQYLNFGTVTYYRWSLPAAKHGVGYCSFRDYLDDFTLQVYDGTNVIAEQVLDNNTSSMLTKKVMVNFAFPTSTNDAPMTITLRLKSTDAAAPEIKVDDCFLGLADEVNLSAVKPVAYLSATSNTSQTSTTSAPKIYEDLVFSTNISYNTGTGVATVQVPGKYRINASTGCGTAVVGLSVYKNGSIALTGYYSTGNSGGRTGVDGFLDLVVGDTIDIRPSASTCASGTDGTLNFVNIELIDTAQGTAYRADTLANSWSGYHDNTCSWARTNTAFGDPTADATCSFSEITNQNFGTVASYTSGGNNLPGIVFTPKRAGKYFVCAHFFMDSSTTTGKNILVDGSVTIATGGNPGSSVPIHNMLCGIVTASSTSSKTVAIQTASTSGSTTVGSASYARSVDWNIFAIDQQLPAPLLVNSVVSKYSGVVGTEHAEINCDAASALTQNPGSWLSAIGNRSTASCALTIAGGVFSATPYSCQVTVKAATVQATSCSCSSATACTVYGASADYDAYVSITGPR